MLVFSHLNSDSSYQFSQIKVSFPSKMNSFSKTSDVMYISKEEILICVLISPICKMPERNKIDYIFITSESYCWAQALLSKIIYWALT